MKSVLAALSAVVLSSSCLGLIGCASSVPATQHPRLPLTLQENSSVRDETVRENPAAFVVGTSRHQVIATMGEPNRSNFGDGEDDEVYAFHSDGSKVIDRDANGVAMTALKVNPHTQTLPSAHTATRMTIYHLYYSSDGTVEAVRKVTADDPTAIRDDPEQDSRVTE